MYRQKIATFAVRFERGYWTASSLAVTQSDNKKVLRLEVLKSRVNNKSKIRRSQFNK